MSAAHEERTLRTSLNYACPLDVLRSADRLMELVPWMSGEGRRLVIGSAFLMGVAAGKRKERARRRKRMQEEGGTKQSPQA